MEMTKPSLWPYSVGDRQAQLAHHADGVKRLYPGIDNELAAALANLVRVLDVNQVAMPPAAYTVTQLVLSKARAVAEQSLNSEQETENVHSR